MLCTSSFVLPGRLGTNFRLGRLCMSCQHSPASKLHAPHTHTNTPSKHGLWQTQSKSDSCPKAMGRCVVVGSKHHCEAEFAKRWIVPAVVTCDSLVQPAAEVNVALFHAKPLEQPHTYFEGSAAAAQAPVDPFMLMQGRVAHAVAAIARNCEFKQSEKCYYQVANQ